MQINVETFEIDVRKPRIITLILLVSHGLISFPLLAPGF